MGERRALFFIIVIATLAIIVVLAFHVTTQGVTVVNVSFVIIQITAILIALLLRRKLSRFQKDQRIIR